MCLNLNMIYNVILYVSIGLLVIFEVIIIEEVYIMISHHLSDPQGCGVAMKLSPL